ncbi:MAG TPA: helix-turn-helix domain-containing protein [Tepidisphaeraceae bacterium]|nr:helix-turn-helix domain-containing protein [Tepidisphaeraceae bacterium]
MTLPIRLLTVRDVAEVLQCSPRKVYYLMAGTARTPGRLRSVRVGGQRRIRSSDLERFVSALR